MLAESPVLSYPTNVTAQSFLFFWKSVSILKETDFNSTTGLCLQLPGWTKRTWTVSHQLFPPQQDWQILFPIHIIRGNHEVTRCPPSKIKAHLTRIKAFGRKYRLLRNKYREHNFFCARSVAVFSVGTLLSPNFCVFMWWACVVAYLSRQLISPFLLWQLLTIWYSLDLQYLTLCLHWRLNTGSLKSRASLLCFKCVLGHCVWLSSTCHYPHNNGRIIGVILHVWITRLDICFLWLLPGISLSVTSTLSLCCGRRFPLR